MANNQIFKAIYKILTPEECNPMQLQTFYDLVVEGKQVRNITLDKIKECSLLAFCEIENEIVGIASIKNPNKGYKKRIFKKANIEEIADNFNFEIGYAFTKEAHRGKEINPKLMKLLIDNYKLESFFATTKVDSMRHLLEKIGFKRIGKNYKNDNNEILSIYQFNGNE